MPRISWTKGVGEEGEWLPNGLVGAVLAVHTKLTSVVLILLFFPEHYIPLRNRVNSFSVHGVH